MDAPSLQPRCSPLQSRRGFGGGRESPLGPPCSTAPSRCAPPLRPIPTSRSAVRGDASLPETSEDAPSRAKRTGLNGESCPTARPAQGSAGGVTEGGGRRLFCSPALALGDAGSSGHSRKDAERHAGFLCSWKRSTSGEERGRRSGALCHLPGKRGARTPRTPAGMGRGGPQMGHVHAGRPTPLPQGSVRRRDPRLHTRNHADLLPPTAGISPYRDPHPQPLPPRPSPTRLGEAQHLVVLLCGVGGPGGGSAAVEPRLHPAQSTEQRRPGWGAGGAGPLG